MSKPAIETTSICNNKCVFCPYRLDGDHPDAGMMQWNTFTEIFDSLPVVEAVMLFNRGEPFVHPQIYQMIEYCQRKTDVILSTNGALVDVDKLYTVFTHGTLCVSMPAGNRETYKLLTGQDNFDLVKQKVIELQNKKPNGVELYVKIVKQKENEGQEEELKKFAKMVHCIEDSNQSNPHGYTSCGQPDTTPTYRWTGERVVCCRDTEGRFTEERYQKGKKRELEICQKCSIQ